MHWRIKGLIQKTLALVPAGDKLHYQLQRQLGGLRNFDRELDIKVDDWAIMTTHLRNFGLDLEGARLMEIGTGWYPTFPLACHLAGASTVSTFDLQRHLRTDLTTLCIAALERHLEPIAVTSGASLTEVQARWRTLRDNWHRTGDLVTASQGGIQYHAPADASQTGLPAGSIDLVFSNSVLEHVTPEVIAPIYREAHRLLSDDGLMFHSVNCGDHYAYVDSRINQLHYLRYSDAQWRFWNNDFLYQNRLRAHHFVDVASDFDFEILLNTASASPLRMQQLEQIPLAAEFTSIDPDKLCITSVDFIARKAPVRSQAAA